MIFFLFCCLFDASTAQKLKSEHQKNTKQFKLSQLMKKKFLDRQKRFGESFRCVCGLPKMLV
jgi:hypothetical protein